MRDHGVGTSWDFGWNPALLEDDDFYALADKADYLLVNEQEALLYSHREALNDAVGVLEDADRQPGDQAREQGQPVGLGCFDLVGRPRRVKTVDTTGAGDAFNGGFLCARLRDFSPEATLRLANFVGAMSTRLPGGIAGLPRQGLD